MRTGDVWLERELAERFMGRYPCDKCRMSGLRSRITFIWGDRVLMLGECEVCHGVGFAYQEDINKHV